MKKKKAFKCVALFFLTLLVLPPLAGWAEQPSGQSPDKALCAKMIQHGQQAYQRGKYLDAKEYFRKAIQADPKSMAAWAHYDQAVIFALAEKVEKNANLVMPDVSTRPAQQGPAVQAPPPPPPKPAAKKKPAFRIVEDEGC